MSEGERERERGRERGREGRREGEREGVVLEMYTNMQHMCKCIHNTHTQMHTLRPYYYDIITVHPP